MNYEALKFFLSVIQFISTLAIGGYVWWTNREKVTNRRFTTLEKQVAEMVSKPELTKVKETRDTQIAEINKVLINIPEHCSAHKGVITRLDGHNDRLAQHKEHLAALEGELKHLPKTSDLKEIYDRVREVSTQIANVQSDLSKIAGAMPGIANITTMMNEFLLNHGGRE